MEIDMAKFATNWVYRTPMRTIEFLRGHKTTDDAIIAAAELAGVLEKETGDGPAKGDKTSRTLHLKG
jgi:hypothetical protein